MSSTSSETNQSQTVTQKAFSSTQAQGFSAEEQSDTQTKKISNVLERPLREGNSSPEPTCERLSDVSSVTPDSSCQAEEMPLTFTPAALHNSECSDQSPKNYQTYTIEETEDFQMVNLASAALLMEDEEKSLTEFAQILIQEGPEVPTGSPKLMATSRQSTCDGANDGSGSSTEPLAVPDSPHRFNEVVEPPQNSEVYFEGDEPGDTEQLSSAHVKDSNAAELLALRHQGDSEVPPMIDQELEVFSYHLDSGSEEVSLNIQDEGAHCRERSSSEAIQSEDVSSQSLSDATPETVTSARHFSFEELILGPFVAPPPVYSDDVGSPVTMKLEMPLSNLGPPGRVCSSGSTPEYTKVELQGTGSPGIDDSDPEGYFDCKQAASDLSELDEPDPRECPSSGGTPVKATEQVLLSSESEEYEDAPFVHEPSQVEQADSEEWSCSAEPSDDEFTLCEAPQPAAALSAGDGTDNYQTRVRRAAVVERR